MTRAWCFQAAASVFNDEHGVRRGQQAHSTKVSGLDSRERQSKLGMLTASATFTNSSPRGGGCRAAAPGCKVPDSIAHVVNVLCALDAKAACRSIS